MLDQTQGTNNYGITSEVSAGTNKRNLNITGTADNVLMGNTGIGTSSPAAKLHVYNGESALQMRIGDIIAGTSPLVRIQGKNTADTTNRYVDLKLDADNGVFTITAPDNNTPDINAFSIDSSGALIAKPAAGTGAVFNEDGVDADFRVESDTNTHALFVEGSSGNVGIGTNAPTSTLHVVRSSTDATPVAYIQGGNGILAIHSSRITGGSFSSISGTYAGNATDFWRIGSNGYADGAFSIWAGAGAAERLRIDSAGNVGIGTSSPDSRLHVSGGVLKVSGNSVDTIISYSDHGIIGTVTNHALALRTNNIERLRITSTGVVRPGADNTQSLGEASFRWSTVFAGTGTINTSDAREKTAVAEFSADELNAAKQLSKEIGIYQFLDSVAAKGESARKHIGLTVQRAIEIMEANNLNPFAYGFICYDEWDQQVIEHAAVEAVEAQDAWVETIEHEAELDEEGNTVVEAWTETIEHPAIEAVEAKEAWTEVTREAGDRFGFRYDQLNMFIARGIEARLAALEAA